MRIVQSLPWCDPLSLAEVIDEPYWALLHSGVQASYSGRYSYLAHRLAERIEATDFDRLGATLTSDRALFENAWFGTLGYGLKNAMESLPVDRPDWLTQPDLCMMRFKSIYQFDHVKKTVTLWAEDNAAPLAPVATHASLHIPAIVTLRSNMRRQDYLSKVAEIIARIHDGALYQANLTRKFIGSFAEPPDAFSLFRALCWKSPAPYSAYIRMGELHVLSSSPELFLRIDADGHIVTRPIKGTAPRSRDAKEDERLRAQLMASEKDRAENLMIADLMRNDLSRSAVPGSIKAERLFEVTTHANVHHMSSTVSGQKPASLAPIEVVKASFPPGSMTGAPKIRAMEICSHLEQDARGIYSGALGWFGGDGSVELSVVIRTVLLSGSDFEFQVGGGIVADSTPQGELAELIHKASGLCAALGIAPETLTSL